MQDLQSQARKKRIILGAIITVVLLVFGLVVILGASSFSNDSSEDTSVSAESAIANANAYIDAQKDNSGNFAADEFLRYVGVGVVVIAGVVGVLTIRGLFKLSKDR